MSGVAPRPEPPSPGLRRLLALVLAFAVTWHLIAALAPPRNKPPADSAGRDFASYYYALQVSADGKNPYLKESLDAAARADGTRREVHPYFYPPPFLLVMAWALPFELDTGFSLWFWLNELCLLAAALALWRWFGSLHAALAPTLALSLALMYGVAYSQELGQANFGVLALVCIGLWQARDRPDLAGALMGLACMMKMSPALFVAWWLLKRQWRPAIAACVTAVVLSLLTLGLVSSEHQAYFYQQTLPRFASGDYSGLTIKIDMFANHSVPNILYQWFGGENTLSATGRMLSTMFNLAMVGALGWVFHKPSDDLWHTAGQVAALCVAILLVPVYTYEHHLVWTAPALAVCTAALAAGRLEPRYAVLVGLAFAALCFEHTVLKQLNVRLLLPDQRFFAWTVQELKFAAMLGLLFTSARLGSTLVPGSREAEEASPGADAATAPG